MNISVGAGNRLKKGNKVEILKAIDKVLENSIYYKNAVSISEGFKKCSGAIGAANKILQMCGREKQ